MAEMFTLNGYEIVDKKAREQLSNITKNELNIDDSLSKTGMAADAKKTGDSIGELDNRITENENGMDNVLSAFEILNNYTYSSDSQ